MWHLNTRSPQISQNNFLKDISNLFHWQLKLQSSENVSIGESNCNPNELKANFSNSLTNVQSLHGICKRDHKMDFIIHLKINSLRKQIKNLTPHITDNADILLVLVTMHNNSFSEGNFWLTNTVQILVLVAMF